MPLVCHTCYRPCAALLSLKPSSAVGHCSHLNDSTMKMVDPRKVSIRAAALKFES